MPQETNEFIEMLETMIYANLDPTQQMELAARVAIRNRGLEIPTFDDCYRFYLETEKVA